MSDEWIIIKDVENKVDRFEAKFPSKTAPTDLPQYVRISAENGHEILRTSARFGASGNQIFVSKSSTLPNNAKVTFEPASVNAFRWFVLCHDMDTRLALIGLFFAVAGTYVDASLAIGKDRPLFKFSREWLAGFSALAYFLKVPGLILVAVGIFRKQAS
jgi:hypothetical protein